MQSAEEEQKSPHKAQDSRAQSTPRRVRRYQNLSILLHALDFCWMNHGLDLLPDNLKRHQVVVVPTTLSAYLLHMIIERLD